MRVSLDDLPDYFHSLREEDQSALLNHLGHPYSVQELTKAGIEVDRKVLADLAVHEPKVFCTIVDQAKAALAA